MKGMFFFGSFRCLPSPLKKARGERERNTLSFLEAVKDYCYPNYEPGDALFKDPTYIGGLGMSKIIYDKIPFFAPHFKSNFNKCATSIHFT